MYVNTSISRFKGHIHSILAAKATQDDAITKRGFCIQNLSSCSDATSNVGYLKKEYVS
jgi:hypothetical protein